MGLIIDLPSSPRPRKAIPGCGAQILLFTGVWRERYETAPAIWSSPERRAGAKPKRSTRDAPKGPSSPKRGAKRA